MATTGAKKTVRKKTTSGRTPSKKIVLKKNISKKSSPAKGTLQKNGSPVADTTIMQVKDVTSNPAPLGLMGFGMTTVLLNLHNANLFPLGTMIMGMGIFYGGLSQIIAGIMEWKKGNTFGTVAFTSYGLFWLSLVALLVLPKMGAAAAPAPGAMAAYLLLWGVFTGCLFVGTLKMNTALQIVFSSLTLLFLLLAISHLTGSRVINMIAGIEGILCGLSAMYASVAQVLNEVYGRTLLPLNWRR